MKKSGHFAFTKMLPLFVLLLGIAAQFTSTMHFDEAGTFVEAIEYTGLQAIDLDDDPDDLSPLTSVQSERGTYEGPSLRAHFFIHLFPAFHPEARAPPFA